MKTFKKSAILLSAFSLFFTVSCDKEEGATIVQEAKIKENPYRVKTVTVNSESKTVYFSFEDNKEVALTEDEAKNSDKWDIAFDEVNGFGNGKTAVYLTEYTNLDDIENYTPFAQRESGWEQTKQMNVQSYKQMPPVEVTGDFNPLLVGYYTFDMSSMPPKADMDNKVRIIKTEKGEYVKFQFVNIYKNPEVPSGFSNITFKYAYLANTGENLPREGEKRFANISPGKLKERLTEDEWAEVKILTIESGIIDQRDMNFIKELKAIEELDLSNATLNVGPYEPFLKSSRNSLKKVIMPRNLKTIGQGWLAYSQNLEEVVVEGNTLEGVLDGAFTSCKKLKKVTLPNSLLSLGYQAFYYSGLETFTCPEKIEKIAYSTFERCTNLKEIFLPNIKKIEPKAFAYCSKLEKLHINAKEAPEIIEEVTGKAGYRIKGFLFYGVTWDNTDGTPFFKVYVPKGAKEAFLKGWGWEKYPQYIEEE